MREARWRAAQPALRPLPREDRGVPANPSPARLGRHGRGLVEVAMPETALVILAAVALLMLKHTVADYFLQTPYQYCNKGKYGHPGGFVHSAIHVALTPLVYLIIAPVSLLLAAGIALGEFVL